MKVVAQLCPLFFINRTFDQLNVKSSFGRSYKTPIRPDNLLKFQQDFDEFENYLQNLQHARKTFVLGDNAQHTFLKQKIF